MTAPGDLCAIRLFAFLRWLWVDVTCGLHALHGCSSSGAEKLGGRLIGRMTDLAEFFRRHGSGEALEAVREVQQCCTANKLCCQRLFGKFNFNGNLGRV